VNLNTLTEIDWELLITNIKSCQLCEGLNCKESGTSNAPGYGNIKSNVVLIGQSLCGKPCIDAQIPFTGGSGKLLDQAFQQAAIDKKDIYITNVVKCHPPENRKSKEHEIVNCTPYLKKELEWISPEHIICLGKDAWGHFNKEIKLPCIKEVKMNDKITKFHYVYHPSYIRRMKKVEQESYITMISEIIRESYA
jgi:DNA polymerase